MQVTILPKHKHTQVLLITEYISCMTLEDSNSKSILFGPVSQTRKSFKSQPGSNTKTGTATRDYQLNSLNIFSNVSKAAHRKINPRNKTTAEVHILSAW